ncbi:MAG: ABC transporter permease [Gemmatimonadaceae bacterium]|nr:ABC transporter permease [Gemmatimonadaceae bacterium]
MFGIGSPTGSVPYAVYEQWSKHPAVRWTVPLAIGDSHRGYRVIGTTAGLFEHWRYRSSGTLRFASGQVIASDSDVVIGSEVAEKAANYRVDDREDHGRVIGLSRAGAGLGDHESHPFTVVGVLEQTFTPLDRALFVTLDGIEEMHGDEDGALPGTGGAPAMPGAGPPPAIPSTRRRRRRPPRGATVLARVPPPQCPVPALRRIPRRRTSSRTSRRH